MVFHLRRGRRAALGRAVGLAAAALLGVLVAGIGVSPLAAGAAEAGESGQAKRNRDPQQAERELPQHGRSTYRIAR
jgi:hypothetical protein